MKFLGVSYSPVLGKVLVIECDCGAKFTHPNNIKYASCENCDNIIDTSVIKEEKGEQLRKA